MFVHKYIGSYPNIEEQCITCLETRTAILYLGSIEGTRTIDLWALNVFDKFKISSSICARGHLVGLKTNSLQTSISFTTQSEAKSFAYLQIRKYETEVNEENRNEGKDLLEQKTFLFWGTNISASNMLPPLDAIHSDNLATIPTLSYQQ